MALTWDEKRSNLKRELVRQVASSEIGLKGGKKRSKMPIYDFRCQECGKVSEIFLRNVGQAARCPNCGSDNMERLITASYMIKMGALASGATCCGGNERCETPPCSTGGVCRRE